MRCSCLISCLGLVLLTSTALAQDKPRRPELRDLFYGEALFYVYQERQFDAIARLDTELAQHYALDEPGRDPLHFHRNQAEFAVGDLEVSYRMHQRAGRALTAIMEGKVSQDIRNEAALRLAQVLFRKNQPVHALHAIERIQGKLPEALRTQEAYLRAQIYIATGRFDAAVSLLRDLEDDKSLEGFAAYNLAIALVQSGREAEGLVQLAKVGQLKGKAHALLALKDKANMTLGNRLMEKGELDKARSYFEQVRLEGPYSNRALLGSGWLDAGKERYERALVPWTLLHKREVTDAAVQEAYLAVPFAYGKLKVYGKAAILYGKAMEVYATAIDRLEKSIRTIREGHLLSALIREEAKQDKHWLYNLRDLPDAPETRYIMDLMASHDFQESLKNYYDLAELQRNLERWLNDLDVYNEMIDIRRRYYQPLLPQVEQQFRKLDTRIRLRMEQRDRLDKRLKAMLIARQPEYLATAEEHVISERLKLMEQQLTSSPHQNTPELRARLARLQGILKWRVETEYDQRLTTAYKHHQELEAGIVALQKQYQAFIRTRQAATQSYEGYETGLHQLRTRLTATQSKLKSIMARQGNIIETLAINELERRRNTLEEYQVKARFAMAESYDLATKVKQERMK